MDDPKTLSDDLWWIRLLASTIEVQSRIVTTGLIRLPVQPAAVRLKKKVGRMLTKVEPKLLELLRKLVLGAAKWPLYLYGRAGTGKTCAALGLCDVARVAVYATAEEAADWIVREPANWDWVRDAGLAVLDELGSRLTVADLHYQAVKKFCDMRDGQPTIYVANAKPDALGAIYDDRIASRVLCGSWYELAGDDRRML